jgi:amino acid transporter
MSPRSRRRRASPLARIAGLLGWIAVAVAIATVVLIVTGRGVAASLAIAVTCGAVAAAVITILDVTGVLRIGGRGAPRTPDDPPLGSAHE